MADKVKFCVVCGRRIPALSLRRRVCSDFCRNRKKSGYAPYINCKEPPYKDLTELQQKAHEMNMTYGQYMAFLEKKRGEKENGK